MLKSLVYSLSILALMMGADSIALEKNSLPIIVKIKHPPLNPKNISEPMGTCYQGPSGGSQLPAPECWPKGKGACWKPNNPQAISITPENVSGQCWANGSYYSKDVSYQVCFQQPNGCFRPSDPSSSTVHSQDGETKPVRSSQLSWDRKRWLREQELQEENEERHHRAHALSFLEEIRGSSRGTLQLTSPLALEWGNLIESLRGGIRD